MTSFSTTLYMSICIGNILFMQYMNVSMFVSVFDVMVIKVGVCVHRCYGLCSTHCMTNMNLEH